MKTLNNFLVAIVWALFGSKDCLFSHSFVLPREKRCTLHINVLNSNKPSQHDGIANRAASVYTFEQMKSMETKLDGLQHNAPELLYGFYEGHLKSFSVRPGATKVSC